MTLLDPNLVETLLHKGEGDDHDYKRDQYPLASASDDEKSELVKDIVAFANAWKTGDAHIVIGADENPGGRAIVVGVAHHLNDAHVQQLLASKTNVPVRFEYIPVTIDGRPLAVIRVRMEQQRPIFLKKAFGRLKQNVVYVRRGSSTIEALPDEVARMGAASVTSAQTAQIEVALGEPNARTAFPSPVILKSRILVQRPRRQDPPEASPVVRKINGDLERMMRLAGQVQPRRGPDPEKLAAYHREVGLLTLLGVAVTNVGQVTVEDVRVVLELPIVEHLRVCEQLPERPRSKLEMGIDIVSPSLQRHPTDYTEVRRLDDAWEVVLRIGKVQPGATEWSRPFFLGASEAMDLEMKGNVYGDNITRPIDVRLPFAITTRQGYLPAKEGETSDPSEDG